MFRFTIFLFVGLFYTYQSSAQVDLEAGLISYFPFSENAADVAGKSNGTVYNARLQDGRCGDMAYYFNGENSYIDCGNDKTLNMNFSGLSFSVWIRPEVKNNNEMSTILAKWGFNERRDQFGIWLNPSNKVVAAFSTPGIMEEGVFSNQSIPYDEWHHVVTTWNRYGDIRIYIDGKPDKMGKQEGRGINSRSDLSLKIGRQLVRKNRAFKGYIDEIRIYGRRLKDSEVMALYNDGRVMCEKILISGTVFNKRTKEPTPAYIVVEDMQTGTIFNKFKSNKDATYEFVLPIGGKYAFYAERDKYLSENRNINTENFPINSAITRDLFMVPIVAGEKLILNNIFFDFNKSTLQEESFAELNRTIPIFEQYQDLQFEIGGHTDNVGSDSYNQKLSEERANAVRDYLVENGVDPDRVEAKGYGESEPISTNDTDEGRQENRRVEFKILDQ